MNFLASLSFKRKIALLVATAAFGVVLITVANAFYMRQTIIDGRRAELVAAVQAGHAIVAAYQAKAAAGQMPDEDAKKAAKEAVKQMRFGGADGKDNYLYLWTLDGTGVMHPFKPEWDGQPMLGKVKDGSGVDIITLLVNGMAASPNGRAFVPTNFPRPGKTEPVPKLQYVVKVPGWNWMVGAGLYMDDADAQVRSELVGRIGSAALLLLVLGGVAFAIARGVLRQIGGEPAEAMHAMNEVARGNLAVDLHQPVPGSLLDALAGMLQSLRSTVTQVRQATEGMNTASSEIASGNLDLSTRTEQAASSLQQTASAMEELTVTVRQSAASAAEANQLAQGASSVASRGGEVMSQVVATMGEINDASKRIADIIGVIDGIAFQTNILALNAAVEAARAGEQGRGFAVVASEVRTLAQRSAAAAKEIKGLIGASVDKVESGTTLVKDAGTTMQEILASVQRVSSIIGEISSAAHEQSGGIGQVGTAVAELDRVTQQNAALVEQSAAAAASLKDQALQLQQVVQVFSV
jgi:methyl-accepting chemotaxis protein